MGQMVTGNDGNQYDMDDVRKVAGQLLPESETVIERDKTGRCTGLRLAGEWMPVNIDDEAHVRALKMLKIAPIDGR